MHVVCWCLLCLVVGWHLVALVVVLVVCVMFSVALLEWFSSSIANGALLLVFCLFVSGSFVFRVWSKPYYFRV